jgi:STE24 endopeptidase
VGLGAALLVVGASFAYPLVFEPLFNRFTPMPDSPLRARLLTLAARDSVDVHQVLIADASRRTTALNAYVSGFGSTRRLVVYDTLLASASDDEVAVVVAHELGHAAHDDVLVGTLEGAVGAALGTTVLFLVLGSGRVRRATGARSAGDPAVVPVVLALAAIGTFAVLPVQNLVSRHIEARADATALDLTRDPTTFIAVQQQLALSNLSHLQPNPVLEFWFDSHPDTLARIEMALQWERLHGARP